MGRYYYRVLRANSLGGTTFNDLCASHFGGSELVGGGEAQANRRNNGWFIASAAAPNRGLANCYRNDHDLAK